MKKLIILAGPPRSGTRIASWAISRLSEVAGLRAYKEALGKQDLDDLWDMSVEDAAKKLNELTPSDKHALIRRCQPHAGRWYSFDHIKKVADLAGRELVIVVLTRDRTIVYQSHYRTVGPEKWGARKKFTVSWLNKAYEAVFEAINKYNLKFFILSYETLMWLKDNYIQQLATTLKISPELSESLVPKLDDGNRKYIQIEQQGCNEPTEFVRPDLHPKYLTDDNTN